MQRLENILTEYDYLFRISIVGDSGVGKSSIVARFADDVFTETYVSTIGVDFKIRTVLCQGKKIKLQLWDTAGQERFASIVRSFYKGAHGFIVVYDITNRDSFHNVQRWFDDIDTYGKPTALGCLIGNKFDLEPRRQVAQIEAKAFADSRRVSYLETSAKSSMNIEKTFESLATELLKSQAESELQAPEEGVCINSAPVSKSGVCCSI